VTALIGQLREGTQQLGAESPPLIELN